MIERSAAAADPRRAPQPPLHVPLRRQRRLGQRAAERERGGDGERAPRAVAVDRVDARPPELDQVSSVEQNVHDLAAGQAPPVTMTAAGPMS